MTTRTPKTIHFKVSKPTYWKDLFMVGCLAIVLGAFAAQVSTTLKHTSARMPIASATLNAASNG
ncbi:MAG TPA: hypothetical protein VFM53_05880 [Anaeromyxobacteraceae bacterium]|jgi:hypothetical protein|nr:hypothetical protein [Anaeromyxobacteraceae bacterium]